jgi:PAS domain S-box-containing protein
MAWQLIASSADCIKVLDAEGRLLFVSEGGIQAMGIGDPHTLLNTPWIDLWSDPDRPRVQRAIDEARQGKVGRFTAFRPDFHGQPKWWEVLVTPVQGEQGPTGQFLAVSRDVTASRAATTELEAMVAERTLSLQQAADQLNQFCHSLAHDLRGPLRTQMGFAQLLLEESGKAQPDCPRYARAILAAVRRQQNILEDLLHHVDIRRAEAPIESLSLSDCVVDVLNDLADDLRERGASVNSSSIGNVRVRANRSWLHLILINLVSNACKFVSPGMPPRIGLCATPISRSDGSRLVRFAVTDNGIGIAPDQVKDLFKMFKRLHSGSMYPGTGMGLANVKAAMHRMGGQVGVDSVPGQGSCFWGELPAG